MENTILIQLLTNIAVFSSLLFIPLMAREMGISYFGLGLILGVFNLACFLSTYFFGILADRYGVRKILRSGLIISALFYALQMLIHDKYSLFWWRAGAGFSAGIFPAALSVYAFSEREGKMGRFIAFGSLGWAIASFLDGIIGSYNMIFLMGSVFFLVSFFISAGFGEICCQRDARFFPLPIFRKNLRIYLPYFLRNLAAQTIWAIFPLYLLATGADKFMVGIAYFINGLAQFYMMQKVEHKNNMYLINLGLLTSVLTFIAYAVIGNYWLVLPVQVMLAYSFSTLQVGANQEVLKNNREKASASGLLNSLLNFSAIGGPVLAGVVMQYYGFPGVMWSASAIAFVGLISYTKVLK